MLSPVWVEITYPFQNFNGAAVEVWEWISNCIPPLIMDEITHPCWDNSQTMQKGYRSYMGWNCIETLTGTREKVQIDKKQTDTT